MNKRCLSIFLSTLSLSTLSTITIAQPVVNGDTISWPSDGWYQVQRPSVQNGNNVDWDVCNTNRDGTSCVVPKGTYSVNKQGGSPWRKLEKWNDIVVAGPQSPDPDPVVDDNSPALISENVDSITQTSAKLLWSADKLTTGKVFYGPTTSLSLSTKGEDSFRYSSHVQTINNLQPGTRYYYSISGTDQSGNTFDSDIQQFTTLAQNTPNPEPEPEPESEPGTDSGQWISFDDIEENGLSNGAYPSAEHYVAEYLYQNPSVRYWEVDSTNKRVRSISVPALPADAIKLPSPRGNGADDSAALERVINNNPGKSFDGDNRVYNISKLNITESNVRIYNMQMRPTSNTGVFVDVNGDKVRFINVHIDGENQGSVNAGWEVTGDDFHLVDSSFINMRNTNGRSGAAVWIKGEAKDYFISGNTMRDIVNASGKTGTNRANPIWISGGKDSSGNRVTSGGGYIVNNVAEFAQSNGNLDDADFITFQTHGDYEDVVRVYGNRFLDAGKRFVKVQSPGIHILSNHAEWRAVTGSLGKYKRLHMISVQSGFQDNLVAQNNRLINNNDRNWTIIFNVSAAANESWKDIRFSNNYVEINNRAASGANYDRYVFFAGRLGKNGVSTTDSSLEAKNTFMSDNVITGTGAARYNYWFATGWDRARGNVDTSGNVFTNAPTVGMDRTTNKFK